MVIEDMSSDVGRLMLVVISYLAPLETCFMSADTIEQSGQKWMKFSRFPNLAGSWRHMESSAHQSNRRSGGFDSW